MLACDLYGFPSDNIVELAERVGDILGITFSLHNSLHRGGDYYRHGFLPGEELILQPNREEDGGPIETDFRQYPTLLFVEGTRRSTEIRDMLVGGMNGEVSLLRHRTL